MKQFRIIREDIGYTVQIFAVDEEHARDIIANVHADDPETYSPNYEWASKCKFEELTC
jgi:hypothetical protein